jgi:hypothetical protein
MPDVRWLSGLKYCSPRARSTGYHNFCDGMSKTASLPLLQRSTQHPNRSAKWLSVRGFNWLYVR